MGRKQREHKRSMERYQQYLDSKSSPVEIELSKARKTANFHRNRCRYNAHENNAISYHAWKHHSKLGKKYNHQLHKYYGVFKYIDGVLHGVCKTYHILNKSDGFNHTDFIKYKLIKRRDNMYKHAYQTKISYHYHPKKVYVMVHPPNINRVLKGSHDRFDLLDGEFIARIGHYTEGQKIKLTGRVYHKRHGGNVYSLFNQEHVLFQDMTENSNILD